MQSPQELLIEVEHQFDEVAAHLAEGDAISLAEASAILQTLSVELLQVVRLDPAQFRRVKDLRPRVKVLVARFGVVRQQLLRRAAFVEQSVNVVLCRSAEPTYNVGGAGFGGGVLQSRAFRTLVA